MLRLVSALVFICLGISDANAAFFQAAISGTASCSTPVNSVAPAVTPTSGTSGQLFTSTSGTWTGSPTFAYQWYQVDLSSPISGATSSTYTAVSGDVGHTLGSQVVATSGACSSSAVASNTTSTITSGGGNPTFALPSGDSLHYMAISANGGSDSNDGLAATVGGGHGPWLTPNHALNCGDVIIAGSGAYQSSGFQSFGTVSNCPSTTGGANSPAGGVNFAILLCGGSDLESCTMNFTAGSGWGMNVAKNNWAVEGWKVTGTGGSGAFVANGAGGTVNHNAFINDVAVGVGIGFGGLDNGTGHDVPGATGFDYLAYVGDIAQNAELNTVCTAAMAMAGPASIDNNSGTHFLWYGNFAWNQGNNGCGSDIENFFMDTPDAHGMVNDVVFMNNIGWSAWRFGLAMFVQNFNSITGLHEYSENNTLFNNNLVASSGNGELNVQMNNAGVPIILQINNIAQANQGTECGALVGGSSGPTSLASITFGTSGNENVLWSLSSGSHATCAFNGYTFSANKFVEDPLFANTTDLLTNRTGAPTCIGFENTAQCMGWNASTSTLTTPSVISDLVPSSTHSGGKGYQQPSITCATNALYPTWLKDVVYLHWTGSIITENAGLVTKPCGL